MFTEAHRQRIAAAVRATLPPCAECVLVPMRGGAEVSGLRVPPRIVETPGGLVLYADLPAGTVVDALGVATPGTGADDTQEILWTFPLPRDVVYPGATASIHVTKEDGQTPTRFPVNVTQ